MKILKDVQGCKESSKELIIGKYTVYIHSNVRIEKDEEGREMYIYDEIQMTKDEYLDHLREKVESQENAMADMMELIGTLGGEM